MKFQLSAKGLSGNVLILLVTLFVVAFCNLAFIARTLDIYPLDGSNAFPLATLLLSLYAVTAMFLVLPCFGRATKPVLILFLLAASLIACFMDSYGIIANEEMLQNMLQTDVAEARDLITFRLLAYFIVLGVLPAILVARTPVLWRGWRRELLARAALTGGLVLIVAASVMSSADFYASLAREHKPLRSHANPGYFIYSVIKQARFDAYAKEKPALAPIGQDAHIPSTDKGRELFVLVIGETARADRMSLNGYARDTTPQLRGAGAISLTNYWACGTSTAVSVPCMFSLVGMDGFNAGTTASQENLLDLLQRAGVNVIWLDNNSSSKGVALRVSYQDFKSSDTNPVCDTECRDEGMLPSLQGYIDSHPKGDIFIVLHQMGNHGPAYYKRYPSSFERFLPVCRSNDLSQCSKEEIGNAYDNALLYTDAFLGKTIELLKRNDSNFETALFYLSDHGESLGESGVYLHGLPRAIAPDSQLHVPAVLWLGSGFGDVDLPALLKKRDIRFTHDNLFHTVLGFMEIETAVYRPEMDILEGTRRPE
jgi:lipid A ethanolaminephosphotransferase